jgi:polyisoprenoid-binding protein YceI
MKKILFIGILFLLTGISAFSQNKYSAKELHITFLSETVLENIFATNTGAAAIIDLDKKDFVFVVPIKSFEFEKELMKEHFNENYMESAKFPNGSFKGKIEGNIDIATDGEYKVNAVGVLDIHGVKKDRTIPATVLVKDGVISIRSKFAIKLVDHDIKVPSVVGQNIAEVINVSVDGTMKKM